MADIDKLIQLDELNVVDGKINLKLHNNTELQYKCNIIYKKPVTA
jgi:hypothetical protein